MDYREKNIRPKLTKEDVRSVLEIEFGIPRSTVVEIEQLVAYDDQNFRIKLTDGAQRVLKITNWKDSENHELIGEITDMMSKVAQHVTISVPQRKVDGDFLGQFTYKDDQHLERKCIVRLFTFHEGDTIKAGTLTQSQAFQWGCLLGKLHLPMQNLRYPTILARQFMWSWEGVLKVREFIDVHKDARDKAIIDEALTKYENYFENLKHMNRCLLHGDLNENNTLKDRNGVIYAALDFGDVQGGPRIWDMAVLLAYVALVVPNIESDMLTYFGAALAGYIQNINTDGEIFGQVDIIRNLVCARLAQSLTLGLKAYESNNDPYVLGSQEKGWTCLRKLMNEPRQNLIDAWREQLKVFGIHVC